MGSTLREFDALLSALHAHGHVLRRKFIRFLSDNLGVVYAIRNEYSSVALVRDRVI